MRIEDFYRNGKIAIPKIFRERLENMQYRVLGQHSAIEICHWTKKALLDEGACYKQRFYGVDAHMCAQIAPTTLWCSNNCIFCWRPMEFMKSINITEEQVEDPELIINEAVQKRRELLIGFKGNEKTCKEKMLQVMNEFPNHWAISLSGEPLLYPQIGEMVQLLKKKREVRSVFIVSNGQEIEQLNRLVKRNELPTQLYISIAASNKEQYQKIHRPIPKDYWERIMESLNLLGRINTRTVIRFTLIKGLNDKEEYIKEFANIFEESQPDFIEIKAYMYLGFSMQRLKRKNMPTHEEVRRYMEKILKYLPSYRFEDEQVESRIVLLKKKTSKKPNIIDYHDNNPAIEITPETTVHKIRSYYRRMIPILRELGIDTEKNTCKTLKELGISKEAIKKLNESMLEIYG